MADAGVGAPDHGCGDFGFFGFLLVDFCGFGFLRSGKGGCWCWWRGWIGAGIGEMWRWIWILQDEKWRGGKHVGVRIHVCRGIKKCLGFHFDVVFFF